MRRLPALSALLLVALALVLTACGGSGDKAEETATPAPAENAATEAGCRKEAEPKPKGEQSLPEPTLKLDPGKPLVAEVSTNCGEFAITLDVKGSPKTSASFVSLAREGFFDGTTFHRVVPGFVIQGGDPKGDGTGGPGYSVVEAPAPDAQYTRGVVAMAKTGAEPAGTSGSQFFVVTGEDAQLPADYAVLGKVTTGQEVVDAIGTVATDQSTDRPIDPVVIHSVKITEG